MFVEPTFTAAGSAEQAIGATLEVVAFVILVALDADASSLVALVIARGAGTLGVARGQAAPRDQVTAESSPATLIGVAFDAPVRRRITARTLRGAAVAIRDALETRAGREIAAHGRNRAIRVAFAVRGRAETSSAGSRGGAAGSARGIARCARHVEIEALVAARETEREHQEVHQRVFHSLAPMRSASSWAKPCG